MHLNHGYVVVKRSLIKMMIRRSSIKMKKIGARQTLPNIASRNGKNQQQLHRGKILWHPPSRPLPFCSIPVLPIQQAEKEAQEVRINGWEGPAAEDKHLVSASIIKCVCSMYGRRLNVVRRYVHTTYTYMGRS